MKRFLLLITIMQIGCHSLKTNNDCIRFSSDAVQRASYISNKSYHGFIFPKEYSGFFNLEGERYTPTEVHVMSAEKLLKETENLYSKKYKRQYFGSLNQEGDTIVTVRLLKNGFKIEECFAYSAGIGLGDYYEKYQRIFYINLSKSILEE